MPKIPKKDIKKYFFFLHISGMSAHLRFGVPLLQQGAPGLGNLQNLRRLWIPKPVGDTKIASLEFPTDPRSGNEFRTEARENKLPVGFEETFRKKEADYMDKEGSGNEKRNSIEDFLPPENKMKVSKTTLEDMLDDYFKKKRGQKNKKKRKYILVSDSEDEDEEDNKDVYKKFKTFNA